MKHILFSIFSQIKGIIMNYGKNLTGEKKGTFTSLDVTGNLNIDNDGSFLSSGNILSSGSISASHADFDELYADRFYCNQSSFNVVEFNSHWGYKTEIVDFVSTKCKFHYTAAE